MTKLVIATGNRHKFAEFTDLLAPYNLQLLFGGEVAPDLQVEETGSTYEQNALIKACAYSKATGLPALADDSGLSVKALNGGPGLYSARYADTDAACRAKLLRELSDAPDRSAAFICVLALVNSRGETLLVVQGSCNGTITTQEMGTAEFGYDQVFLPLNKEKTFGQMTSTEKAELSHRGLAFKELEKKLPALLEAGRVI